MIKKFVSTIEQAQQEANALLTKGDWTEQSSSYCACGESASVKVRDAETGKVRAIFAVCEACIDPKNPV
jgi:hypothetical protein